MRKKIAIKKPIIRKGYLLPKKKYNELKKPIRSKLSTAFFEILKINFQ